MVYFVSSYLANIYILDIGLDNVSVYTDGKSSASDKCLTYIV
jgi:hypothetical protein